MIYLFRISNRATVALAILCSFGYAAPSSGQPQAASGESASSAPAESDGVERFAEVIQVDGTRRRISYFRDKRGLIIPPAVVDGKLVDGSIAPAHSIRARNAQVKILVRYDKAAQIRLAMVWDRDLITESGEFVRKFMDGVESGGSVSVESFHEFLYQSYISIEAGIKGDGLMKLADTLATAKLKLLPSDYEAAKTAARERAKRDWRTATGALD